MADNPQISIKHPELTTPAQEPEAPASTAQEPKAGFYGGKYESLEAWEQATRHSEQEGARLANRTRELEAQIEADRQRMAELEQRANPAQQRMERKSAIEELTEMGIPIDPLRELLRDEVTQLFAPQMAINEAMGKVMARRPDFGRYRTDVDTWLASHPDVNQRYQEAVASNPKAADMALDWVFDRFVEDRRAAAGAPSQNGGGSPSADATIPAGHGSQSRTGPPVNNDEELQRAAQYGRQYGDMTPYGRERLREVLNRHPDLPQI